MTMKLGKRFPYQNYTSFAVPFPPDNRPKRDLPPINSPQNFKVAKG